jgi:hypothetical protein
MKELAIWQNFTWITKFHMRTCILNRTVLDTLTSGQHNIKELAALYIPFRFYRNII